MASGIIHMCVAKEINKKLCRNEKEILLGSIAPDLCKLVGETKTKSHFLTTTKLDVPNILEFINKYQDEINQDFCLGYFIHLYTDKLWFGDFLNHILLDNKLFLLDGRKMTISRTEAFKLIYHDYDILNIPLSEEYQLNLSTFCHSLNIPNTKIDEIPIDKLQILLDNIYSINENSFQDTAYLFDIIMIKQFIRKSANIIYQKLIEFKII